MREGESKIETDMALVFVYNQRARTKQACHRQHDVDRNLQFF